MTALYARGTVYTRRRELMKHSAPRSSALSRLAQFLVPSEPMFTFELMSLPQRCGWRGRVVKDAVVVLILVVEDEFLIQELVDDALSEGGFQTEVVATGEDAISLLQGEPLKYRALLTDVNLKGNLSGWDVARRARELNPEIPVIYMTGAAAGEWPSHGVPNSVLLNKPFAPAQVVTAVSQLLNQTSPLPE